MRVLAGSIFLALVGVALATTSVAEAGAKEESDRPTLTASEIKDVLQIFDDEMFQKLVAVDEQANELQRRERGVIVRASHGAGKFFLRALKKKSPQLYKKFVTAISKLKFRRASWMRMPKMPKMPRLGAITDWIWTAVDAMDLFGGFDYFFGNDEQPSHRG